jgi:hypothetical protein
LRDGRLGRRESHRSIASKSTVESLSFLTFFKAFWKLCSGFSFRASTLLNEMKSARSAMVRSGERKNKQNTHPEKETESLSKKKNGLFFLAPCSLSLFFLRNSSTPKRKGGASCCPSPFSLLRDSTRARKTKRVS